MAAEPCHWFSSDDWLAGFLGKPAFHLDAGRATHEPDVLWWLAEWRQRPCFIDAKAAADDLGRTSWLEDAGFRVIDTLLTFERGEPLNRETAGVREASAADADAVAELAGRAFAQSRFHLDSRIGASIANRIKAAWARNYFAGRRGDAMVVAEQDGRILGFLQLIRGNAGTWAIDLIAVDADARGRGLGGRLVAFAARRAGCRRLRVGTQVANVRSIRLYESLGFRLVDARYVFHLHGGGSA